MGQLLIRNLDENVILRLKDDAKSKGLSLEQYLRDLLTQQTRPSKADLYAEIDRLFEGRDFGFSKPPEELIREDRDNR